MTDHERAKQWLHQFRTHVKEVIQNDPDPNWEEYDSMAIALLTQHFREVREEEQFNDEAS